MTAAEPAVRPAVRWVWPAVVAGALLVWAHGCHGGGHGEDREPATPIEASRERERPEFLIEASRERQRPE